MTKADVGWVKSLLEAEGHTVTAKGKRHVVAAYESKIAQVIGRRGR